MASRSANRLYSEIIVVIILLLLAGILFYLFFFPGMRNNAIILKKGANGKAVITEFQIVNDALVVHYTFNLNSKSFTGTCGHDDVPDGKLHDTIDIKYLSDNPAINAVPQELNGPITRELAKFYK